MLVEESEYCRGKFDGGGSLLKAPFVDAVRKLDRTFGSAYEWCAGMGEIGYAILQAGLCRRLCLSDINPGALEVAREIARREGLEDVVDIFAGDNVGAVPASFRFDLVVANPPNFFNVQKDHPAGARLHSDLRPNDRGWKIHEKFYATVGPYLAPDAVMLIEEVEPYLKEVYYDTGKGGCDVPYDIRDEVPMEVFERMTRANGLKITEVLPLEDGTPLKSYALKIVRA